MSSKEEIDQLLDQYPPAARARRERRPKPNGGVRLLASPNPALNQWLKAMDKVLKAHYNAWPAFMHGGINKRSYISYARPHVGKQCVITIDIRDCFDSITSQQVATALQRHLSLDGPTCINLSRKLSFEGNVAQGFATSNFVCNLYLKDTLQALHDALGKDGIEFTNYVDDLALSGAFTDKSASINKVITTLSGARLAVSKAKICVMPAFRQQIICGLIVNKRLSLTKAKKLELLSAVAKGTMSSASASGWVANLKSVDPAFRTKFYNVALKKGLIA